MSKLQVALHAFPTGTIVTPQMMKDHKALMELIDNNPNHYVDENGTIRVERD